MNKKEKLNSIKNLLKNHINTLTALNSILDCPDFDDKGELKQEPCQDCIDNTLEALQFDVMSFSGNMNILMQKTDTTNINVN